MSEWINLGNEIYTEKDGSFICCVDNKQDADLIAAAPELLQCITMGQTMQTPEFLHWIADRLVYVHGEKSNVDFIISLRKRADAMQVALNKAVGQ